MIGLIKNEFFKLLHKKSTYVVLIVMFLFCLLVNVMVKNFSETDKTENYSQEIKDADDTLTSLDKNSKTYNDDLATYNTQKDVYTLANENSSSSWKVSVILNKYRDAASNYYVAKYVNNDTVAENEFAQKMDSIKKMIQTDDWKSYVNEAKDNAKKQIDSDEENVKNLTDKNQIQTLKNNIEYQKYLIYLYDYRLNNNINFDNSYLNKALNNLESTKLSLIELSHSNDLTDDQKKSYDSLNKEVLTNEYALNNKVDVVNEMNLTEIFKEFYSQFSLVIIIFIIMVSGSIVSDEFNKGTIKSLLTVPYKRTTILTAKLLTVLLCIPLVVIFMILAQTIIGGFVFGFNQFKIPLLVYSYSSKSIIVYNVFKYLLASFIHYLPYFTILAVISFMLSTIVTNTAFAVTVTYFVIIASQIVNSLAVAYNIKFLKYFITLNWDFSQYAYGAVPAYKYISLPFSISIYILYILLFIFLTFFIFNKRDIKNI